MYNTKCLTTIESASLDAVSRVVPKPMRCEKRRVFVKSKIVIWSDLHGDMQPLKTEVVLRSASNNLSADTFLGLPFNIAFYATLTHMFAHVNNMVPLELVIHLGDVHIYNNHRDQVHELLSREPFCLPRLEILNSRTSVLDFEMGDLEVRNYKRHGLIKADVAI